MLTAAPMVLFASQTHAENWVTVITDEDGLSTSVDKDSIRRGSDGFVYYTVDDAYTDKGDTAADCQRRVYYTINHYTKGGKIEFPNWRHQGIPVKLDSDAAAALQYACKNAG